jgi:hypothetical protein
MCDHYVLAIPSYPVWFALEWNYSNREVSIVIEKNLGNSLTHCPPIYLYFHFILSRVELLVCHPILSYITYFSLVGILSYRYMMVSYKLLYHCFSMDKYDTLQYS